jgi:hypothetical protein
MAVRALDLGAKGGTVDGGVQHGVF